LLTNFVACQGFGMPAYRLTLPMRIPIGTHRVLLTSDSEVPVDCARLASIDRLNENVDIY
jgi:hypothetical protein